MACLARPAPAPERPPPGRGCAGCSIVELTDAALGSAGPAATGPGIIGMADVRLASCPPAIAGLIAAKFGAAEFAPGGFATDTSLFVAWQVTQTTSPACGLNAGDRCLYAVSGTHVVVR